MQPAGGVLRLPATLDPIWCARKWYMVCTWIHAHLHKHTTCRWIKTRPSPAPLTCTHTALLLLPFNTQHTAAEGFSATDAMRSTLIVVACTQPELDPEQTFCALTHLCQSVQPRGTALATAPRKNPDCVSKARVRASPQQSLHVQRLGGLHTHKL